MVTGKKSDQFNCHQKFTTLHYFPWKMCKWKICFELAKSVCDKLNLKMKNLCSINDDKHHLEGD